MVFQEAGFLSRGDPTDHVLATIASIFERPAVKPIEPASSEPAPGDSTSGTTDRIAQTAEDVRTEVQTGPDVVGPEPEARSTVEPDVAAESDADTYHRFGPGPLESLRFKWSARRGDDGRYYVDETIGDTSLPISSGPIPKEAVIAFIDEREREARLRFENLRNRIFRGPSERGALSDDG